MTTAHTVKSFYHICLLMCIGLCECSECHPRGGGGWTCGSCSSCQDPEIQRTRVAIYAFWIHRGCHKWRSQPRLLSTVQSNLGGEVQVSIASKYTNLADFKSHKASMRRIWELDFARGHAALTTCRSQGSHNRKHFTLRISVPSKISTVKISAVIEMYAFYSERSFFYKQKLACIQNYQNILREIMLLTRSIINTTLWKEYR